jgi:NAD(P)-dependent dehydrogenase (short-subunit alcohol dehydrogenase family)
MTKRMNAMGRLSGKAVMITGAGKGIGREAALLFAREGASVAIADIDAEAGDATREAIEAQGGEALFLRTDITKPEDVQGTVGKIVAKFGKINVLYNNAGGSTPRDGTVVDAPIDEFWRAINVDLFGTWLSCRFAIPEIKKAGGGVVINMVSNVALMGIAKMSAYTAAKGGIASLTRAMAVDFAPTIRVNAIAPSVTLTDRLRKRLENDPSVQKMAAAHLVGLAEPVDIAHAALYLASDESRMVTGQILRVDSGITIV